MAIEYSDTVIDHFEHPRNVGTIPDADGVGKVGSPVCGDVIHLFIKVEDAVIADIKYKTFGCAASIASGSIMSEMVRGRSVGELLAKGATPEEAAENLKWEVVSALGGLPEQKVHCSLLATDALYEAIRDYQGRHARKGESADAP